MRNAELGMGIQLLAFSFKLYALYNLYYCWLFYIRISNYGQQKNFPFCYFGSP